MLFFKVGLVGATGIEPVTPTVSRWFALAVRRWRDLAFPGGWFGVPGFCRAAVAGLAIVAVAGCDDDAKARAEENARTHKPVMIAEADGVKLWKVKDATGGGALWVYFTSGGDAYWEQRQGKTTTTRWMVPGVKP